MSKYDPLNEYLAQLGRDRVKLAYEELERILGDSLPPVAARTRQWWCNNPTGHPQAKAWLDAGWTVETVKLGESVTMARAR
jgi:hypothetical protein